MKIEKLNTYHNAEFTTPATKNFVNAALVPDDTVRRELRQHGDMQRLLAYHNDTIAEIRKISENEYHVLTTGGHTIPIEIVYAPYRYAYRFQSLSWDHGTYNLYCGW